MPKTDIIPMQINEFSLEKLFHNKYITEIKIIRGIKEENNNNNNKAIQNIQ